MNKVILIGRLTKEPDIRISADGQTKIARYTLAVDRRFAKRDGEGQTADFISCVVFGKGADFADQYLRQGTKIAVVGRLQTGSFTGKDGQKIYTTDVVVEEQEFAESKRADQTSQAPAKTSQAKQDDTFMSIPDGVQESLPWE